MRSVNSSPKAGKGRFLVFQPSKTAMISLKLQPVPSTAIPWTLTPEASPRLSPIVLDWDADDEATMSADDQEFSKPISITTSPVSAFADGIPFSNRPTLDDVLGERSHPPYTLSAFTAYLSQQHCLETLEFTVAVKNYGNKYTKNVTILARQPVSFNANDLTELQQDWVRLLDIFIKPGAPREINLPAEERDDLLEQDYSNQPPSPETLHPAVQRMHDLMSDSIFLPFLNSFNPKPHAKTFSGVSSDFGGRRDRMDIDSDLSRPTLDDRDFMKRKTSRRRRSPPSSVGVEFPRRQPAPLSSHGLLTSSGSTSALNQMTGSRLSTYMSNSSATSGPDCSLTDDSGSGDSPGAAGDPMTPPTTPPGSEIPLRPSLREQSPKANRSDSGSWRKMGMRLWGKKRSGTGLRERSHER